MMALVHFYFNEEPNTVERLSILYNRLMFVLEFKGELKVKTIDFK